MTSTNGSTTGVRRTTRSRATTANALDDVKSRIQKDIDLDPKTRESIKARKEKVKKDSAEMSIEKATSAVAAAKIKITQTLDSLNEEINGKLEELRVVNEAIDVAESELQELHDNDLVLSSTADLIARHELKKKELEDEISALRATWAKEQEAHDLFVKERNQELDKARKREADDYNFNLGVHRRNEEQTFNEQVRVRKLHEQQRQEAFEKSLQERNAVLTAKEQELVTLKAKADSFDAEVKAAVDDKLAATTRAIAKDHKVEIERLQMQRENDVRILQLEVENLRKANSERDSQIARLQSELAAARESVKELATSAMAAQSGKAALDAVQAAVADKNIGKK